MTMLKSMLHEYAQRRHSSDDVHGQSALVRAAVAADRGDGPTTPRRYSEDAQHWIGNVTLFALLVNASQAATAKPIPFFIAAWRVSWQLISFCALVLFALKLPI